MDTIKMQSGAIRPIANMLPRNLFTAEHEAFRETGRFGVIGAITEDMWKGGFTYLSESWETSVIGHAGIDSKNKTTDIHVIAKAGYRH
ncbi:MAG: hypothetical protein FGM23_04505, partial [Alphaproteobacteria bacterium]|nr:hypothetical protein [Alphaproteobacteria bacterium]